MRVKCSDETLAIGGTVQKRIAERLVSKDLDECVASGRDRVLWNDADKDRGLAIGGAARPAARNQALCDFTLIAFDRRARAVPAWPAFGAG